MRARTRFRPGLRCLSWYRVDSGAPWRPLSCGLGDLFIRGPAPGRAGRLVGRLHARRTPVCHYLPPSDARGSDVRLRSRFFQTPGGGASPPRARDRRLSLFSVRAERSAAAPQRRQGRGRPSRTFSRTPVSQHASECNPEMADGPPVNPRTQEGRRSGKQDKKGVAQPRTASIHVDCL